MSVRFVSVACLYLASGVASAVMFPMISDPRITSCEPEQWGGYECADRVAYASSGTIMVDLQPLSSPLVNHSTILQPIGVHCTEGDAATGVPFTQCRFTRDDDVHSPRLIGKCELISTESWELTPDSTCDTDTTWGKHFGAGVGGECVLFQQRNAPLGWTVWGQLSSAQVANAGSTFCQKPLPPSVICEVDLPDVIDHGTIGPNATSDVSISGAVRCGASPTITILGGSDVLQLGEGVRATLVPSVNGSSVTLSSRLTSHNARSGDYRGSVVLVAAPY